MPMVINGDTLYMSKHICSMCGRIVDKDHDCPNRPKDTRKKQINVDSRWRKIRQEVRERDLCCKLCWSQGIYSKGEEVHHIIPREADDTEGMVFNPDNCIYLCQDCHHRVHNDGWQKYVDLFKEMIE